MAHEPHDSLLYYCSFTEPLEKSLLEQSGYGSAADYLEAHGATPPVFAGPTRISSQPPERFAEYYTDVPLPEGSSLSDHLTVDGVLRIPGSMYHFTHKVSPLRNATSLSEVERFPFPRPEDFSFDRMREVVEAAHADGRWVKGVVGHLYEDSWAIRGYEPFLMDMMSEPDVCDYVFDRIFERNLAFATAAAAAGVDILHTGDDVANQNTLMFSKEIWRAFIKSRWQKTYEAAREINPNIEIWYHSDGNITDIIDELIEIGVTVLNPVQPECMDLPGLKKRYGSNLVFDGTIGTQTTMPFGTPDEVVRVVEERKRTLGTDGALILSPTHVLEPEVPLENIEAFLESCAGRRGA